MSSDQSRTIGLGALLALVVVVKMTGALDWLTTIFSYRPYAYNLNPLSGLSIQTPFGTIGASGGGGSSSSGSGGGASSAGTSTDSGTHQALDASGNTYTINSSYANMSDAQKGDANRFAHQVGNVSG